MTSEEQNKVKRMKTTDNSLRDLWDNIKCTNIRIIGVPEEEEKTVVRKFLKRLWLKISPTWKRKQSSPRVTMIPIQDKPKEKQAKTHTNQTNKTEPKERILRAAREKQHITYKRNPICLTANLSAEILQARREWQDIFKVLKGKNL